MANHRRGQRDTRDSWQDRPNYASVPYSNEYNETHRHNDRYGDSFGRPYGVDYPYTDRNYNQQYGYPYGTGSREQNRFRGGSYEGGYSNPDYRQADDHRHSDWSFRNNPSAPTWPESNQARFWERQGNGGRHRGKGPKGYIRSDERIKEDISDRLSDHDDIDASEVEVTVNQGEVILSGTVNDRYEKRIAEECAEQVSGVTNVENRIRLQQQGSNMDSAGSNTARSSAARPAYSVERTRPKNQAMNES